MGFFLWTERGRSRGEYYQVYHLFQPRHLGRPSPSLFFFAPIALPQYLIDPCQCFPNTCKLRPEFLTQPIRFSALLVPTVCWKLSFFPHCATVNLFLVLCPISKTLISLRRATCVLLSSDDPPTPKRNFSVNSPPFCLYPYH